MSENNSKQPVKSQSKPKNQKAVFLQAARELECDEDEDRFNATLKRIVPVKPEKDEKPSKD